MEAIFEVFRETPRVRKATNRAMSIHRLTQGLLRLAAPVKCVLVEDDDDARFYAAAQTILATDGVDSRLDDYSLSFVSAGIGKGSARISGGRENVEGWATKLRASGLQEWVAGLVDRDYGGETGEGVYALSRYSIENYLLDPIVVFAALMEKRHAPAVELSRPIRYGGEALLAEFSVGDLEKIRDAILTPVAEELEIGKAEENRVECHAVEYQTGVKLQLPYWLFSTRGKDLVAAFRAVFDGSALGLPQLTNAFEKVRLVPVDLVKLFKSIRADGVAG